MGVAKKGVYAIEEWYDALEASGCDPKGSMKSFFASCPAHTSTVRTRSLNVRQGLKGSVIVICHAGCSYQKIKKVLFSGKAVRDGEEKKLTYWFQELPDRYVRIAGMTMEVKKTYLYADKDNAIAGAVLHMEGHNRRKAVRIYAHDPANTPIPDKPWCSRPPASPRPLYGLDDLMQHPEAPVWVVSNEKSVEGLSEAWGDFDDPEASPPAIVTWMGGVSAIKHADWSAIKRRTVYVLSDATKIMRRTCLLTIQRLIPDNHMVFLVQWDRSDGEGPYDFVHKQGLGAACEYIERNKELSSLIEEHDEEETEPSQIVYKKVYDLKAIRGTEVFEDILINEGVQLRFNRRSGMREIKHGSGPWSAIKQNSKLNVLRLAIQENYGKIIHGKNNKRKIVGLRFSIDDWHLIINNHDVENEVDDFIEWLEHELPPWDKKIRNPHLLSKLFNNHPACKEYTLDSRFGHWASNFLTLAPIQQAYLHSSYDTRDQIDTRPLFVGDKWIGKSKMLRTLIPHDKQQWFNPAFTITRNHRDMVEQVVGCIMVEASELAGLNGSMVERWKSFSTAKVDRVRLAYRKDAVNHPRLAIIIGTTNSLQSLPDDAGGWRRDLPILLGHAHGPVEPYIEENRIQMWAEGLHRFRKGERAGLPYHNREQAIMWTKLFQRRMDPLEDAITNLPRKFKHWTTYKIMKECGIIENYTDQFKLTSTHRKRLADILVANGCEPATWLDDKNKRKSGWTRRP